MTNHGDLTRLRRATPEDLARLLPWSVAFERSGAAPLANPDEPFIETTLRELDARPYLGGVYVIETERGPVGYALLLRMWSNETRGRVMLIDELFIAPEHRGGTGRAALEAIAALARSEEIGVLVLEVDPADQRVVPLYERAGFVPARTVYYRALDAE